MYMIFWALGGLVFLLGFICWIVIVIKAFKTDTTQGILCLCIWPYAVFWSFAKMQSDKKMLLALGSVGGPILGYVLFFVGGMMVAPEVGAGFEMYQQQMQQMQQGMQTAMPGMPVMTPMPGMTPWPGTTQ